MNTQKLIYLAAGLLLGFAAGFFFTNSVNRREHDALRAEVARLRAGESGRTASGASASGEASPRQLSDEEIRQKIAAADANPGDLKYGHELGRLLFLYATNFDRPDLLPEIARVVRRVHEAAPDDEGPALLLANTYFLMGQTGDPARYADARAIYSKLLRAKPGDVYLHTALGLAYFHDRPSDPRRAITEFRKSLASDPRHEMTLQGLTAALLAVGETEEARRRLEELQGVNPSNPQLPALRADLERRTNETAAGQRE